MFVDSGLGFVVKTKLSCGSGKGHPLFSRHSINDDVNLLTALLLVPSRELISSIIILLALYTSTSRPRLLYRMR